MKNILLALTALIFTSCNSPVVDNTKSSSVLTKKPQQNKETPDRLLKYDAEKIALLSLINNIPIEKTNAVLTDYLSVIFSSSSSLLNDNPNAVIKLVDSIATDNNLTKQMTASIIFAYQYEMITKNEIIDEIILKSYLENKFA